MPRTYGSHMWNGTINAVFPDRQMTNSETPGVEWEVSVEMDCTYPGCSAKLSGLPEDCYPAEGPEFEWRKVHVFVGEHTIMETDSGKALALLLGDAVSDHVLDEAAEDAVENWEPEGPEEP